MTTDIRITDSGFAPAPPHHGVTLAALAQHHGSVELGPDDAPEALRPYLQELSEVRIAFPNFADGRGFTSARRLRMMGYRGTLVAVGYVLADQYAMARRVGFDAVEISAPLAARQGWEQWQFRADDWQEHNYLSRLRAAAD